MQLFPMLIYDQPNSLLCTQRKWKKKISGNRCHDFFLLIEEYNFKLFLSNITGNFNIKVTMNIKLDRKLFLGQER